MLIGEDFGGISVRKSGRELGLTADETSERSKREIAEATQILIAQFRAAGVRVAFRGSDEPETGAGVELVSLW